MTMTMKSKKIAAAAAPTNNYAITTSLIARIPLSHHFHITNANGGAPSSRPTIIHQSIPSPSS
jgi:hypothetical protein